MLNSLVGMVDRTRQAVALLKERVMPELERREVCCGRAIRSLVAWFQIRKQRTLQVSSVLGQYLTFPLD